MLNFFNDRIYVGEALFEGAVTRVGGSTCHCYKKTPFYAYLDSHLFVCFQMFGQHDSAKFAVSKGTQKLVGPDSVQQRILVTVRCHCR